MPENPPPGRGIAVPRGAAVQVAYVGKRPEADAQVGAFEAMICDGAEPSGHSDPAPFRVDVVPYQISYAHLREIPGWQSARGAMCPIVAIGGDELTVLDIDLARFPGFAVAGPPLSGRSTALLIIAESLLAAGTAMVVLAPRQSPLRDLAHRSGVVEMLTGTDPDPNALTRLLRSADKPLVVLVDDAEALHYAQVAVALSEVITEGRGRRQALVVAGTSGELLRTQRSFTMAARQFRCGLLLTPESAQLGQELFGVRLPRRAVFDRPPGRGYLIRAGRATLVQVPHPST